MTGPSSNIPGPADPLLPQEAFGASAPIQQQQTKKVELPITYGSLLDFPRDPINTMRRLYERHGRIAVLEQEGSRIVFGFGQEYNQKILHDTQSYHSHF